ncbi:MAG: hypothetical protein DMF70_11275 [Acidobacteria bacterium]|nr:MAG: hypothetical protein DMF70_11275 [Acidobacteriota bacterium]
MNRTLAKYLCEKSGAASLQPTFDDHVYHTIKIQFQALGLIEVQYLSTTTGGMGLFWSLTDAGQSLMMSLRAVRSGTSQ